MKFPEKKNNIRWFALLDIKANIKPWKLFNTGLDKQTKGMKWEHWNWPRPWGKIWYVPELVSRKEMLLFMLIYKTLCYEKNEIVLPSTKIKSRKNERLTMKGKLENIGKYL